MGFGDGFAASYLGAQQQQIERANQLADQQFRQQQLDRQTSMDQWTQQHNDSQLAWQKEKQQQDLEREAANTKMAGVHAIVSTVAGALPWMGPQNAMAMGKLGYEMYRQANPKAFPDDFETFMARITGGNAQGQQPDPQQSDKTSGTQAQQSTDQQMPPWAATGPTQPGQQIASNSSLPWMTTGPAQNDEATAGAPQIAAAAAPPGMMQGQTGMPGMPGMPQQGSAPPWMQGLGFDPNSLGIRGQNVQSQMGRREAQTDLGYIRADQTDYRLGQHDQELALRKEMGDLKSPVLKAQADLLAKRVAEFDLNSDQARKLKDVMIQHLQNQDRLAQLGQGLKADQFRRSIANDEVTNFRKISDASWKFNSQIQDNNKQIKSLHGQMSKLMQKPDALVDGSPTAQEIQRISNQAGQIAEQNRHLKADQEPLTELANTMLDNLVESGIITDNRSAKWVPDAPKSAGEPRGSLPAIPGTAGPTDLSKLDNKGLLDLFVSKAKSKIGAK